MATENEYQWLPKTNISGYRKRISVATENEYQWLPKTNISGYRKRISMATENEYQWLPKTNISGYRKRISVATENEYQWLPKTNISGYRKRISMATENEYQWLPKTNISGYRKRISVATENEKMICRVVMLKRWISVPMHVLYQGAIREHKLVFSSQRTPRVCHLRCSTLALVDLLCCTKVCAQCSVSHIQAMACILNDLFENLALHTSVFLRFSSPLLQLHTGNWLHFYAEYAIFCNLHSCLLGIFDTGNAISSIKDWLISSFFHGLRPWTPEWLGV